MQGVVMFSGKSATIEVNEVEITHASFYLPLINLANLTPKRGEKNFHPIMIDRNIVNEGNIALDLFIDFTALCCYVEMIVLVITGKPISMFKMVRQITKKVIVFIHHTKRNDVARQYQNIPIGLQWI
jgi:hypothetical protein